MKAKTIRSKMLKAGHSILVDDRFPHRENQFEVINFDTKRRVRWSEEDGVVYCLHCGRVGDESDIRIDYFPGYYVDTAKAAVAYLNRK